MKVKEEGRSLVVIWQVSFPQKGGPYELGGRRYGYNLLATKYS